MEHIKFTVYDFLEALNTNNANKPIILKAFPGLKAASYLEAMDDLNRLGDLEILDLETKLANLISFGFMCTDETPIQTEKLSLITGASEALEIFSPILRVNHLVDACDTHNPDILTKILIERKYPGLEAPYDHNLEAVEYQNLPIEHLILDTINSIGNNTLDLRDALIQTPDIISLALEHDPSVIKHAINPTTEHWLSALRKDGSLIRFHRNPTREEHLEAITQDGLSVVYLRQPSSDVRIRAIEQNPRAIFLLSHASELELNLALELMPELVLPSYNSN